MKTISVEVEDRIYKDVVNFLRLLPEQSVHVLEDDGETLSPQERETVLALQARLKAGDDSEFEDWETVKAELK
ncbi:hypothetical protein A1507_11220 [Methylomonas koyamae]|uniref:Addiction module component n=1 Tax=Methylomonas koyamae TaxID=702114 RepID=A0A177NGS0_9GAMM|nr:hypothetical protein [Methylomonas koyamae]OAI17071.1 hypothetical protein A1507_11220 [Methylomonas koyamae]